MLTRRPCVRVLRHACPPDARRQSDRSAARGLYGVGFCVSAAVVSADSRINRCNLTNFIVPSALLTWISKINF
jgi:hypothetical protein